MDARMQSGDRGPDPPRKLQSYRFITNTGPVRSEDHKATKISEYDQEIPQSQASI